MVDPATSIMSQRYRRLQGVRSHIGGARALLDLSGSREPAMAVVSRSGERSQGRERRRELLQRAGLFARHCVGTGIGGCANLSESGVVAD